MESSAKEFSINFLQILEDDLKVENVDIGKPTFIPQAVNQFSFQLLSSNLEGLVNSSLLGKAIDDVYNLSDTKKSGQILTSGVGFADEFHEFVKLGYLLGDKVVLWDSILPNILNAQSGINSVDLSQYLFNILKLKEIVKNGDLIYLPHPRMWCDETRYYFSKVRDIPTTNDFIGMLNAWTLNKSGLHIFPYFMKKMDSKSKSLRESIFGQNDKFSEQKFDYHSALADFLQFQDFSFLSKVDINDFYKTVRGSKRYGEFKSELHGRFSNFSALSDDEKELHTKTLLATLRNEIKSENEKINKKFDSRVIESTGTLSVIGGAVGASFSLSTAAGLIALLSGLAGSYSSIRKLISDFRNPHEPSVFYQVFSELQLSVDQRDAAEKAMEQRLKDSNIPKNI